MNSNKVILKMCYKAILLYIFMTGVLYAQELTFEKEYNLLGGYYVQQTNDQGFIISAQYNGTAQVIRMDNLGEVIWNKQFPVTAGCFPCTIQSYDNNFIYVSTENKSIWLTKVDQDGKIQWRKTIDISGVEYGLSLNQVEGENLLITGYLTKGVSNYIIVIRTDQSGNVIWHREYRYRHAISLNPPSICTRFNSESIYVAASFTMYTLSINGDSLSSLELRSKTYSIEKLKDGFLLAENNAVSRISETGTQIWKKEFPNPQYSICMVNETEFISAGKTSITRMNINGDSVWIINKVPDCYFITNTKTGGFIAVGGKSNHLWLLKFNANGSYANLNYYSYENEVRYAGMIYNINFYKQNVQKVNIDFTHDNGKTWTSIVTGLADTQFSWELPFAEYDSCRIRISDPSGNTVPVFSKLFAIKILFNYDLISINNITMWIGNDGISSHNIVLDGSGLYWPKNSPYTLIYLDGLLWGGKIDDKIYVGGSTYRTGLTPIILGNDKVSRIWKLRNNWENLSSGEEKIKFTYNYENWPGEYGAPFNDINHDGIFTRGVDSPGIKGDETLWYTANDFDTAATRWLYGSDPMGIEMQSTTYAYNRTDDLADVVFKKYKLINKSGRQITEMYLSYWSDPDLGYANDDCAGCDTVLNLGYVYNGDNYDESYYGVNPPAAGYAIVQGPVTVSQSDSAFYDEKIIHGKKNLKLSAFLPFLDLWPYIDPTFGTYEGSLEMYNIIQGKFWDGSEMINPATQKITRYALSGDPVAGIGWYEGKGWIGGFPADDRRFLMSSGPFNLAEADTQEIVIAFIAARGSDYINSVAELKRKARFVQEFYNQQILTGVDPKENIPVQYSLFQNYPNPFNPATTIKYVIPEKTKVTLKMFDVLGKEVATLVDEEKPAGNYQVRFNAKNLSSGVYYYQMKTNGFVQTKKMILIK